MRKPPIFLLLCLLIYFSSCQKNEKLFVLIDPNDSGIDFQNQIFEDDKVNIIDLEYVYNGGGVSVGDFNKDGLQDLFFTGNMVPNKIYLNRGGLEFEDVSETAGIAGYYKWKSGSAVVDINNDGWLDVYVCATISADSTLRKNMMFVNQGVDAEGNLLFKDLASQYGIDYAGFSTNAGFFDYDRDGDLDLYILTNRKQQGVALSWKPKVNDGSSTNTDKLFKNNGDGSFTDVSIESGITSEGYGLGLAFFDVNNDDFTDIYVSNDYITNDILYVNQGNGNFKNEIDHYMKHQSKFAMGNDVADINNDGFLDIITVDMMPETNFRKKTVIGGAGYISYINDVKYGYAHQYVRNMLQLNNGNGSFGEIGQLAGVYQTEWSWSPLFADFDNDGLKDLIVTNGFPKDVTDRDFISFRQQSHGLLSRQNLLEQVPSVKVPNSAFRNNGDLTFTEVTQEWGLNAPSFSNGAAYADLDNDGDLDYVTNNINSVASLYENTLYQSGESKNHFLRVKLTERNRNPSALGAKLTLYQRGNSIQYTEHAIYRGYLSTVEDYVHFGLGANELIDSLRVQWPSGNSQVIRSIKADQVMTIEDKGNEEAKPTEVISERLFEAKRKDLGFDYIHLEIDKIDFNIQRTLPHKLSQSGPGLAVGDINMDGLDDFIVGGSANYSAQKFIQTTGKKFSSSGVTIGEKTPEDTGLLLFDADNDHDLDLYCVSGSYEFEPGSINYQDRLYKNDGRGNFSLIANALPRIKSSGSCVRAADFDYDGDLDLFVGGRTPPGRYPYPDSSFLLVNNNGKFSDLTSQVGPDLKTVGMVTDALWTDFNNDNLIDLIVVGEFMPVTFFQNKAGKLNRINTELNASVGWFNSIAGGDFDSDGDTDYIVGNLGLNNFYNTSSTRPLTATAKDFDNNGSVDAVLSCFAKSEQGELKSYPIHFWDELNAQSPKFRQRYNQYKEFARITTDQFFSPEELKGALVLSANFMTSAIIINKGKNQFSIEPLPLLVQTAPVNGICLGYFNQDENLDACLVGNDYGYEPTYGQQDAFTGLVLLGDGGGKFKVSPSRESGFVVDKDAKGLARLSMGSTDLIIATQNRDSLKVFSVNSSNNQLEFGPLVNDYWGEILLASGKKQRVEFYLGSGYLSQSTRKIRLPKNAMELVVYGAQGKRTVKLTK